MLARIIFLLGCLAFCGVGCAAPSHEPPNLLPHKQAIAAYVKSGDYDRDIAAVAQEAQTWLEQRVAAAKAPGAVGGSKLAIVFDLDETLLSNWPQIRAQDFGYVSAVWDEWVQAGEAPAIEPVRELYRTARRLGVEVFFLTGRRERDRAGTEKNLRAIGCGDYAALIVKPSESKELTGPFKVAERRKIVAAGYTIIVNIGDQESDLAGGFAERTFKLPNPFYLTQ